MIPKAVPTQSQNNPSTTSAQSQHRLSTVPTQSQRSPNTFPAQFQQIFSQSKIQPLLWVCSKNKGCHKNRRPCELQSTVQSSHAHHARTLGVNNTHCTPATKCSSKLDWAEAVWLIGADRIVTTITMHCHCATAVGSQTFEVPATEMCQLLRVEGCHVVSATGPHGR